MKNPTVDLHSPEADAIRQAAETLRGKSKQELMETLRQTMGEQRAAGTLDNEQLDDVFQTVAPYLTSAQQQRMSQIFGELKK